MKKKLNCVLLIDDDKGTNFINQMIIKKSGITDNIQTVLNGKEAIDFITNKGKFEKEDQVYPQPMLTLLDINMPVMDGWEFMEELTAIKPQIQKEFSVYIVSSSIAREDKDKAKAYDCIKGFISKPINLSIIEQIANED